MKRAKVRAAEDDHGRSIPDEIMFEIQNRLPPKSLFRFKCVCKAWRSLFQDETFMDLYSTRRTNQSKKVDIVVHQDEYYELYSITNDGGNLNETRLDYFEVPDEDKIDCTVMPPCKGLFCFRKSKAELNVWNPSTKEIISLDVHKRLRRAERMGFGFDIASKKFKVIGCEKGDSEIQVLTVGEQEWRSVEGGSIQTTQPGIDQIVYLKGALYWFTTQLVPKPDSDKVHCEGCKTKRGGQCKITSFDLANETFGVVPLPSQDAGFVNLGHRLSQVEGCLCLIGHDYKLLDLWVLTSPGIWINRHISLPFDVTVPLDTSIPIRNGEILVQCRKERCFYLCQYDDTTTQQRQQYRSLKTTKVTGFTSFPYFVLGMHEDTLVSLKNYM
ncbi:hypothetical protein ACHQM5_013989 [Ranunculus cassubicifolius]